MLLTLLILSAVPSVQGLDKPKKAQTAKLGKSELAAGTVVAKCWDLGKVMLVEIDDPGLKGAKDAWLKKKTGDAMPPCDGNDTDTTHLESVAGYGYIEGTKGDFILVAGSDTFGDRLGLRVVSATNGALLVDVERSISKPASLHAEGTSLWLRFHGSVPATCDPVGAEGEACWKQVVADAKIPEDVKVTPPDCAKVFKGKQVLPGSALLAVPMEIDLNAPKTKRFRAGDATCDIAP